jgi:formylglycine-generating enzyme required for sulfatase activity
MAEDRWDEQPQHQVTFAKPFAVAKFELAFDEWDTCVAYGDCTPGVDDGGWGRGRQPAINLNWANVHQYVAWLSRMTGKPYRLLTEAEFEYATRAGSQTAYPWGNDIGENNANCDGCGSRWDSEQPAPVGSFAPNRFGLYDMVGNVYQWVADCSHPNYDNAPTDGSVWTGECSSGGFHVARSGSWLTGPDTVRSANRSWQAPDVRLSILGFRVARELIGP